MFNLEEFVRRVRPNTVNQDYTQEKLLEELQKWPMLKFASMEPSYIDLKKVGKDAYFFSGWIKPTPRVEYM